MNHEQLKSQIVDKLHFVSVEDTAQKMSTLPLKRKFEGLKSSSTFYTFFAI